MIRCVVAVVTCVVRAESSGFTARSPHNTFASLSPTTDFICRNVSVGSKNVVVDWSASGIWYSCTWHGLERPGLHKQRGSDR